jgi:hypothetical protein
MNFCFHGGKTLRFWKHCGSKREGNGAFGSKFLRKPDMRGGPLTYGNSEEKRNPA